MLIKFFSPNEYLSIIYDGADQSANGMPHFKEKDKNTAKGIKQRIHLLGALVEGGTSFKGDPSCYLYTMSDKWEHGSNQTIELLQRTLLDIESKKKQLPPVLFLQADNCWRENKNRFVMGYLSWLIKRGIFREIYLSFLPVGHTHEVKILIQKNIT